MSTIHDHLGHTISARTEAGDLVDLRCEDCGVNLEFVKGELKLREPGPLTPDWSAGFTGTVPDGVVPDVVSRERYQAHVSALVVEKGDLRHENERLRALLASLMDPRRHWAAGIWTEAMELVGNPLDRDT